MSVLDVVNYGDPILRKKCKQVTDFSNLASFIEDMFDTMYEEEGIGLAANQVGEAKRVITMYIPHEDSEENPEKKEEWHNKRFTFINPQIVKKQGKISWQEGCLSFPLLFLPKFMNNI